MSALLFFDLDGTLWTGPDQFIPDSTREAIAAARARGHLCFVNSGRSRSYIHDVGLFALGFDGIVSSCGMQIELPTLAGISRPDWAEIGTDGRLHPLSMPERKPLKAPTVTEEGANGAVISASQKDIASARETVTEEGADEAVIFYRRISRALAREVVDICRRRGYSPLLEGKDYSYMTRGEFPDPFYGRLLSERMGSRLLEIDEHRDDMEFTKFVIGMPAEDGEGVRSAFGDRFHCMIHTPKVAEIVPLGFDKSTALSQVCALLGADVKDTVAFGDSLNDVGMLRAAGCGVVMGNGAEGAKAWADMVTAPVLEDGIWKAMRALALI